LSQAKTSCKSRQRAFAALAVSAAFVFVHPPLANAAIVVREDIARDVRELTPRSPAICRAMQQLVDQKAVSQEACEIPLPSTGEYQRPAWKTLSPEANLSVVKEATFWMFWRIRITSRTLDDEVVPKYRTLLTQLNTAWAGDNSLTRIQGMKAMPQNLPINIDAAVEEGWKVYGDYVLSLIAQHKLTLATTTHDLDGDGHADRVYRITKLEFGFPKNKDPEPHLLMCKRGTEESATDMLFVSSHDDPSLSRGLLMEARTAAYDTFLFRRNRYAVSRERGYPNLGWISRISSATAGPRGIQIQEICQFDTVTDK
jgi:hypothetical protein